MYPRTREHLPVRQLLDTFSFWGAAAGLVLGRRCPKLAGGLLLTIGLGYVGIVHERRSGSTLRGHLHRGPVPWRSLAVHLGLGAYGWNLLNSRRRVFGALFAPGCATHPSTARCGTAAGASATTTKEPE